MAVKKQLKAKAGTYTNKQGEENLKALFENKLELAKAVSEFKAQLGTKAGGLPSDAKMAEWMVANGVAPDAKAAYSRIKHGVNKDDVSIQASIFSVLSKDAVGADPKELWAQAGRMVNSSRGGEDKQPSAPVPHSMVTVNGKQVDYFSLKPGETYTSPDGKTRRKN